MASKEQDVATDATVTPVPTPEDEPSRLARGSIEAPTNTLLGREIGAYRILDKLGSGAMGEVYRAVHRELDRPVAIKVLKPQVAADRTLVGRFFAEARAVNLIRHENIVECTDLIRDDDGCYMVMELLEGRTLATLNREAGALPWPRAVGVAAQIAEAIAAAHDKGIIHRDLKPDNVFLIRRRESQDYVKILDFGIAHLNPEQGGKSATQTGHALGTPAYMSPEQVRGEKARAPADIYCLGVMLFEMLTGRLPFEAESAAEVMVSHLSEPPPDVSNITRVPARLARLVRSMMDKDAAQRPDNMSEVARTLRALQGPGIDRRSTGTDPGTVAYEETAPSERQSGHEDTERPAKTDLDRTDEGRTWLPIALAVGALVLLGVAIIWMRGGSTSAAKAAGAQPTDAAAGSRFALDSATHKAGLPPVPHDCGASSAEEQKKLVRAVELLAGGRPGHPRDADRDAAELLAQAELRSPEGMGLRARASLLAGDLDAATDAAKGALESCPELALAHATLGVVALSHGRSDEALDHLRRATDLAPNYIDGRFNLGLAQLAASRVEDAVATFDALVTQNAKLPNLLLARGEAQLLLKNYQAAVSDLRAATESSDDAGRAYLALGFAQRGLGREDEANAAFCKAADRGNDKAAPLCAH